MFGKQKFIKLPTVKDYDVYVRKDAIIRVWNDNNVTAVMYSSNAVDHIKMPLNKVLEKLK